MKLNLMVLLILLVALSCNQKVEMKTITDITKKLDKSSGFVDLTLSISSRNETDSTYVYLAEGLYKSDTVGIEVSLKKGLNAGVVNGEMKNVFMNNGILIHSIGKKSDKLLQAMTELYEIDSINQTMRKDLIMVTAANLNEKNVNYTSGEYKFKIFLETEDDVPELFVNFDFTNGLILLNEKDQEYREGVLRYLMEK